MFLSSLIATAAETTTNPVVESLSLFPANFWSGVLGTSIYFLIGLVLLALGYKVIDWITPGDLGGQILGVDRADKQPNLALGIMAGLMFLGMCIIVAAAIH